MEREALTSRDQRTAGGTEPAGAEVGVIARGRLQIGGRREDQLIRLHPLGRAGQSRTELERHRAARERLVQLVAFHHVAAEDDGELGAVGRHFALGGEAFDGHIVGRPGRAGEKQAAQQGAEKFAHGKTSLRERFYDAENEITEAALTPETFPVEHLRPAREFRRQGGG